MIYRTTGQDDTYALGQALGGALHMGDSVLLKGDLGMGKSVLARGIARALGVDEPMPSPTFTLMQPYEGRVNVCHFDLYRLNDIDEFEACGLNEYVGGDWVALIEWPFSELDAAPSVTLTLERGATEDERRIDATFDGMDSARVQSIQAAMAGWEARA